MKLARVLWWGDVSAKPVLEELEGRVDVMGCDSDSVHALRLSQSDFFRGFEWSEASDSRELADRYLVDLREFIHVHEHGLPTFVGHHVGMIDRRMQHPVRTFVRFDPVHHERFGRIHETVDVRDRNAVGFEDLHYLHLESEVVLAGDRPIAAHKDRVDDVTLGVCDFPLGSPSH